MNTFYKTLKPRQICDVELVLDGSFAPLTGFLGEADYHSVLADMRLADGSIWPVPINLPFTESEKVQALAADRVVLRHPDGYDVAEMALDHFYQPDLAHEARSVLGSDDPAHPYVQILQGRAGQYYAGGKLTAIESIKHKRFPQLRHTPAALKQRFKALGWTKIVAFQTRNPMHQSHYHLTLNALSEAGEGAKLLLHPVVGVTQDVDIDYDLRVRCYQLLLGHYPENSVELALLPLSMRMAGPREAVWHALIRKNYGATHFVVGRDHAGPSFKQKDGSDFYAPYAAQELLAEHADEIGITVIQSKRISYVKEEKMYLTEDQIQPYHTVLNISGTEQRHLLRSGQPLQDWFTFPEIREELQREFHNAVLAEVTSLAIVA